MGGVRLHPCEGDRLDSPASYRVLDTPTEASCDALAALAARACGTPLGAVDRVLTDPWAATVVDSVLRPSSDLGLRVVAEGVETEPVRRRPADAGCRWAQGWLFGAAVPGALLPRVLGSPERVPQVHGG